MKKICTAVLCILAIIFGMSNAFAKEIATVPIEIDLGDGLIFWMVLPEDEELGYPTSGLYKNGELIYTVDVDHDWWWSSLHFSRDAMSFIRSPFTPRAVRFYQQGVLIHEYDVLSLLRYGVLSLLPPYGMDIFDRWRLEHYDDRENDMLRITTTDNIIITFDLTTGLILSEEEVPEEETIPPPGQETPEQEEDVGAGERHVGHNNILAAIFGTSICIVILLFVVKFVRSRKKSE